jgi:hypothetical protein
MTRFFIPLILIAAFAVYALYLLLIKKDRKQLKAVLYPGLFFTAVWGVIYWTLLR